MRYDKTYNVEAREAKTQIRLHIPQLGCLHEETVGPWLSLECTVKIDQDFKNVIISHRTTGCFDDRLLTRMTDTGFFGRMKGRL